MKRSGCRQPEAKGQLAEVQRKRDGPEVERQRLMGWLEGEAADEQTRARLDEVLRRVRTRMGRLSDDERYEVVHAVIRDVRVDNQGGVEITSYLPEGKNRSGGPSGCGSDQFVVTTWSEPLHGNDKQADPAIVASVHKPRSPIASVTPPHRPLRRADKRKSPDSPSHALHRPHRAAAHGCGCAR